jgi:uncharacterized membrane protein YraQ (UPF0718 family)
VALSKACIVPFADLVVLPVLDIYRKYYGLKVASLLFAVFIAAMAAAGYVVEALFGVLGWVPRQRELLVVEAHISWNYTTILNIIFLGLSALMVWRFLKTGNPAMLRMMNRPMESDGDTRHA